MHRIKLITPLLLLSIIIFSCGGKNNTNSTDSNDKNKSAPSALQNLGRGKGSLSFKANGQLYQTDPLHTKCWTTANIPLAMLIARGEGTNISWEMGYVDGTRTYKLDGDSKGKVNFTIGDKTYWTKSGLGKDYLNITILNVTDKYSVRLLSGTFEGHLEDKDGNQIQITEGKFETDDI